MAEQGHGGEAVARALQALGVKWLFTLTGGHIFPILDGCHRAGIAIAGTRHEQTAAFAAEGWARLTRSLGVTAVTAGPGVTNAMSALAQARFNGAPLLALAGRAPSFRWGQGSLQEIDHVAFTDPLIPSETVEQTSSIAAAVIDAARAARSHPRGPRLLDFPLDALFNAAELHVPDGDPEERRAPDAADVQTVASLLASSRRPVLVAGSNVYLDGAENALRRFAEKARVPVFVNGQGRGCLPADHPLAFARSRSKALSGSDLVIVAGTPLDFRLSFGDFGGAQVVHIDGAAIATHVELAASIQASTDPALDALADAIDGPTERDEWLGELAETEEHKRDAAETELVSDASPIHPMRVYGELVPLLERDAIVICDGGDFASYAGREVASYEPGAWLDPGPFGCLGCGFGYAIAAGLAHPGRRVVLLLGDGALGFAGMDMETLVRLDVPVVCIVGNNGIWGLEKHPMRHMYGYDVAADLQPGLAYEDVMRAFGGWGERVEDPAEVGPALKRAFDRGEPALVNVITDPEIAYPRSATLV